MGPDRHRHTAGLTFSNQVRAQDWLANELGLIERGEWTPPAERRRQVEAAAITFDEFARDWIDKRLVRGRPLKDRTREHYLDIHERWLTPLHTRTLSSITGLDIDRWYHGLPDAPTMRSHAYSLLKSIFRTAVAHRLVTESPVAVEGATARTTPKDITLLTVAQVQALADAMPPRQVMAEVCDDVWGQVDGPSAGGGPSGWNVLPHHQQRAAQPGLHCGAHFKPVASG